MDMKFEKRIISKKGQKVLIQCSNCNATKSTYIGEHNRTCVRQSKYCNSYLCYDCLQKNDNFIQQLKQRSNQLKTDEWRDKCRKVYSGLNKKELINKIRNGFKNNVNISEWKLKLSNTMKNKFKNDIEYKDKITKARKLYWKDPEYIEKQKRHNERNKKNGTGIYGPRKSTWIEKSLYYQCEILGIKYEEQYRVGFYRFDCFLPDHNILIECNGDYTHTKLPSSLRNDKSKATYIEKYFPNYIIKTIWEHEFYIPKKIQELLIQWTGSSIKLVEYSLLDVVVKEIDNLVAVEFIQKHHYTFSIGHGRSQLRYGAFINDTLIAVACFASPTRNESADRLGLKNHQLKELVKLCSNPLYCKPNLLSYVLSRSIKLLYNSRVDVKCLITFADTTYGHTGSIYKACNWVHDGIVDPSYWYIDKDGYVMHKKTLYNHASRMHMKESDFAKENGYFKVKGKEKIRFIKWLR
jgi:very-short-patch-repair endonuclease